MLRYGPLKLENSLAEVLSGKHADQTIGSVVNALSNCQFGLDTSLRQPLLQVLLVILEVGGAELGVANEETLEGDLLGNELHQAVDALLLVGRGVVV